MRRIALFASGTGSNVAAIIAAIHAGHLPARAVLLICDNPTASVIDKAKAAAIPLFVFHPKQYRDKAHYEAEILAQLKAQQVQWLILAGYMRLIGPTLLTAYPNTIVNIHPSLLPNYKGANAVEQAIAAGERVIGVSIHYVDVGMDTGQLIAQEQISLMGDESLEAIKAKIHQVEHGLYPKTLAALFKKGEG